MKIYLLELVWLAISSDQGVTNSKIGSYTDFEIFAFYPRFHLFHVRFHYQNFPILVFLNTILLASYYMNQNNYKS